MPKCQNAKTSHSIKNLRTLYNNKKNVKLMCQYSNLYISIYSGKFQVVLGLDLQLFNTMESCDMALSYLCTFGGDILICQTN